MSELLFVLVNALFAFAVYRAWRKYCRFTADDRRPQGWISARWNRDRSGCRSRVQAHLGQHPI